MKRLSATDVEREIVALQNLKTAALQTKWREVFGNEPPSRMRAGFLQRAIAYRLQEQAFGGLRPATKKELQRLALAMRNGEVSALAGNSTMRSPARLLSPGTRLLREWNGATELVEVVEDRFVWRSQTFRTLSAVAVAITGTKWSGPKFFGLDRKPQGKRDRGSALPAKAAA